MNKKKILVVDRDIVARRAVSKILRDKQEFRVVPRNDVPDTVNLVSKHKPDLLLLSIKLSSVEELALISTVRNRFPDLPLVVLTERNEEGAVVAISALRLGAVDFITKPVSASSLLFSNARLCKRLIPVVRSSLKISPVGQRVETSVQKSFFRNPEEFKPGHKKRYGMAQMICMGGCTGGAAALFDLIPDLPAVFPVPVLVAQHFPGIYTKVMAEKLDEISDINVKEGSDGEEIVPGTVYVIPGGYHGEVSRGRDKTLLKLHRGPRHYGFRPSIDLLFRSVGNAFGRNGLGVILSGKDYDGVEGAGIIQNSGGQILVQSPRSSLSHELPMAVLRNGFGNACYPMEEMGKQLVRCALGEGVERSNKLKQMRYLSDIKIFKRPDKYLFGIS